MAEYDNNPINNDIRVSVEAERQCGFRVAGGLYLVSNGEAVGCGRLPIPLHLCPTCGAGVKFSRSLQWIESSAFSASCSAPSTYCGSCSLHDSMNVGKVGLMWVGESFYKTPETYIMESLKMGISRRIPHIPKQLVLGKTWIWLAHRKVDIAGKQVPAVFRMFQPQRIEYIVREEDTVEKLEALKKRGISLVKVIRNEEPSPEIELLQRVKAIERAMETAPEPEPVGPKMSIQVPEEVVEQTLLFEEEEEELLDIDSIEEEKTFPGTFNPPEPIYADTDDYRPFE